MHIKIILNVKLFFKNINIYFILKYDQNRLRLNFNNLQIVSFRFLTYIIAYFRTTIKLFSKLSFYYVNEGLV